MEAHRKIVNYSHKYFKLDDPTRTTVRSVNYCPKHNIRVGTIGYETLKKVPYNLSKVTSIEHKHIFNMNIGMLKRDVEYEGFAITDIQEFVDCLNQIVKDTLGFYGNHKITTTKAIITIKTIKKVIDVDT